jgi:hypothetical protein
MRTGLILILLCVCSAFDAGVSFGQDPQSARPTPSMMDTPGVHILKGLTVPEFQDEMNFMVVALGVNCGYCHVRNNFASDDNPRKATARRMLEMVNAINQQFFPDYHPAAEESRLGKVTCYTCHQGETTPHQSPAGNR